MSNNVSNTSEEYDSSYYYDSLDLLGHDELVNAFLERDGVNSALPNILFASEFKPLYKKNISSDLSETVINGFNIKNNDELKTNSLFFLELQHFLRQEHKKLLEKLVKFIGTDDIIELIQNCKDLNQSSDNYEIFREYVDKTFPEILQASLSLNFSIDRGLKDQFTLLSPGLKNIEKFEKLLNSAESENIFNSLNEETATFLEPEKIIENKSDIEGIFKSFILSRAIQFETFKSFVYSRLINTKADYELYESLGAGVDDQAVFTQSGQNRLTGELLSADFFDNGKNIITDNVRYLQPCEFTQYNRHQINLGFYAFHKLFTIDAAKNLVQPVGKNISQNDIDFLKLYLSGQVEYATGVPKYIIGESDPDVRQSGSKKILNIGIPNGLVTKLNLERWNSITKASFNTEAMTAQQEKNFNPNYVSTLRIDIYKTNLLDPHNKKYKRVRKYFDMDTFTFNDGVYDPTDVKGEVANANSFEDNLGKTHNFLSRGFNDVMKRADAINNFPVYKVLNGTSATNKEKNLGAPVFAPVTINSVNLISDTTVNQAYKGASSIEDVEGIDKTYSGNNSSIVRSIIRNHIEDHVLKNYTRVMMGVDVSEENFHYKQGKLMNINNPIQDLNNLASANGYEKDTLKDIIQSFLSEEEKLDDMIDNIDIVKLMEKEFKKSLVFAGPSYARMCLRPKMYDRIFSILIDDRMFELTEEYASSSDSYSEESARMCKYEINISLADQNFSHDYASPDALDSSNFYNHMIDFTVSAPIIAIFPSLFLTEEDLLQKIPNLGGKSLRTCRNEADNVINQEFYKKDSTFIDEINSATYSTGDASDSDFSQLAQIILNTTSKFNAVESFYDNTAAEFADILGDSESIYHVLKNEYGGPQGYGGPASFYYTPGTLYSPQEIDPEKGPPGGPYDAFGPPLDRAYKASSHLMSYELSIWNVRNSTMDGLVSSLFGFIRTDESNTILSTDLTEENVLTKLRELDEVMYTVSQSEITADSLNTLKNAFKGTIGALNVWPLFSDYHDYHDFAKGTPTVDGTLEDTFELIYNIKSYSGTMNDHLNAILGQTDDEIRAANLAVISPYSALTAVAQYIGMSMYKYTSDVKDILTNPSNTASDMDGIRRAIVDKMKSSGIGIVAGSEGIDVFTLFIDQLMRYTLIRYPSLLEY